MEKVTSASFSRMIEPTNCKTGTKFPCEDEMKMKENT